jgi:hypothetical protein
VLDYGLTKRNLAVSGHDYFAFVPDRKNSC